jgi:hypothetical protein
VNRAWNASVLHVEQLQQLSTAVDEIGVLLRCRKALCDEGMKSLLELLKSRQSYYVRTLIAANVRVRDYMVWTDCA